MNSEPIRSRRGPARRTRRRGNAWLGRAGAAAAFGAVVLAGFLIAFGPPGGGSTGASSSAKHGPRPTTRAQHSAVPPRPGTAAVPILTYHVIASPPSGTTSPNLYVPQDQFSAQMQALKAAGWHAITLDQLEGHWSHGTSLGAGKPIVLTFDTGYHSQYANALPVLRSLGWVGNENLVVNGFSPSEGGIGDTEIRGLISAGWEIDTQGVTHRDLIGLGAGELQTEVASSRQLLHQRYGVPVNWFSYPLGHYDATVLAAVKGAGYTGGLTTIAGLAAQNGDPYRFPRITVLPGTSPSALLAQITSAQGDSAPPPSYSGAGLA
ncbi:MAG TPA: polysaccharide deacetylase family protein [Solirubrobacteraceae bacterium]